MPGSACRPASATQHGRVHRVAWRASVRPPGACLASAARREHLRGRPRLRRGCQRRSVSTAAAMSQRRWEWGEDAGPASDGGSEVEVDAGLPRDGGAEVDGANRHRWSTRDAGATGRRDLARRRLTRRTSFLRDAAALRRRAGRCGWCCFSLLPRRRGLRGENRRRARSEDSQRPYRRPGASDGPLINASTHTLISAPHLPVRELRTVALRRFSPHPDPSPEGGREALRLPFFLVSRRTISAAAPTAARCRASCKRD